MLSCLFKATASRYLVAQHQDWFHVKVKKGNLLKRYIFFLCCTQEKMFWQNLSSSRNCSRSRNRPNKHNKKINTLAGAAPKNVRVTVSNSKFSHLLDLLSKGISMLSGTNIKLLTSQTSKKGLRKSIATVVFMRRIQTFTNILVCDLFQDTNHSYSRRRLTKYIFPEIVQEKCPV